MTRDPDGPEQDSDARPPDDGADEGGPRQGTGEERGGAGERLRESAAERGDAAGRAVERDSDFVLECRTIPAYQPIVEVDGGEARLHAVEALTRLNEKAGFASVTSFFGYVRRQGLEMLTDRACVVSALAHAPSLPEGVLLTLNVHATTLARDADFPDFLTAAARRFDFDPSRLVVEVVEEPGNSEQVEILRPSTRIRTSGIGLAIDNVGCGFSNFQRIMEVRPDYLKVDRIFVSEAHDRSDRRAVLASVRRLATDLGARVVAEGVEERRELEVVRMVGIDLVQGRHLAPPLPRDRIGPGCFLDPFEEGAEEAESGKRSGAGSAARRSCILVVDDSRTSLAVMVTLLDHEAYDILTARSGEEALELAADGRPDIILMSVDLSGMGGVEACRRVHAEDATREIPVVLVARSETGIVARDAREAGCTELLTTPLRARELRETIRRLLEEGSAA